MLWNEDKSLLSHLTGKDKVFIVTYPHGFDVVPLLKILKFSPSFTPVFAQDSPSSCLFELK